MEYKGSYPLLRSLEMTRRRLYWMVLLFGFGIAAAITVAVFIAIILADYLLDLNAIPRLALIVAGAVGIGYAFWQWILASAFTRLTLNDIANRVEKTFPEYEDRLLSTVNFLSSGQAWGSEVMKQRVVGEASRMATGLDMSRVIISRPVWFANIAGGGSLLLLGILIATISPLYLRIACSRLLTPFALDPWPRTVAIAQVGTLPDTAAVGQQMEVAVRLSRGDRVSRKAILHFQYIDNQSSSHGLVQEEYMARGSDGTYRASLDAGGTNGHASSQIKVWIDSGDGELTLPPIRVVPRLAIKHVEVMVVPPPYADRPAVSVNLSESPAVITAGAKLMLTAVFNKSLRGNEPVSVDFFNTLNAPAFQWKAPVGNTVTAEIAANESFHFHLRAMDSDGLSNSASEEYEVVVRPDQPPSVTIEIPQGNQDCTPDASVPVQMIAEDDYGIKEMQFTSIRLADKQEWAIPLVAHGAALDRVQWHRLDSATQALRFDAQYSWDLAEFPGSPLHPGDVLEYYASVRDNYELNKETHAAVSSGKLHVSIISQEEFSNKVVDELNAVSEQVGVLRQSQRQNQHETADLSTELSKNPVMDTADRVAFERIEGQQSTIASQTKALAGKLVELQKRMDQNKSTNQELKKSSKEAGDLLNSVAEGAMKNSAGDLSSARQSNQKADVIQKLAGAQTDQSQAVNALASAQDRIGATGGLSGTMQDIQTLLSSQQKLTSDTADAAKATLGKGLEDLSDQERKQLNDLSKAQADLAQKTRKMLDEISQRAMKMSRTDPIAAKAMTQASSTGNSQDIAGQQVAAAESTKQNKQSQAQDAQKQAENGLQMMLEDLHQGQNQKQGEVSKKLDDQLQGLASLIQHQAGHNLDNLTLQGGDLMQHVMAIGQMNLFDQARRDSSTPTVVPDLETLISAQQQTERDTRDIAKATTLLENGSDPADHLTRAADRMERATANLHDRKLADAYSPSQDQALVELLAAQQILAMQKQQADQQQDDDQKNTIKQAYEALLTQQTEVNLRTSALDAMPRKSDGSLRRQNIVLLAQLPPMQLAVIDGALSLDEPLAKLDSIVYSWANKDLVKSMKQVQQSLQGGEIRSPTQFRQQQVIVELNAIIDDLLVKPKKTPPTTMPAAKPGGDPPPSGPPNMPTEAEVRLMIDLQRSENQTTVALSQQSQPNRSDLKEAGDRQGELRELLDKLIRKASKGKTGLRPESDLSEQLPEEKGTITTQPRVKSEEPTLDDLHDLNLIGTRMSHVHHRLALDGNAGAVTQAIQTRILDNLNTLLQQVRKKASPKKESSKPRKLQPKKGDQPMQAGVDIANSNSKGKGAASAGKSRSASGSGGDGASGEPGADVARQQARMWGEVAPRERDAVIEGQSENVLDKYKNLVNDYYREMSTQGDEH